MRRLLLLLLLVLTLAARAEAAPQYATITGTLANPDGSACAICQVTFRTIGNQNVGGTTFQGQTQGDVYVTDAFGALPGGVLVARTLVVGMTIAFNPEQRLRMPDSSSINIADLAPPVVSPPLTVSLTALGGILTLSKGGTGSSGPWTPSKCIHTNSGGTAFEVTANDCGTGGGASNSFVTWTTSSGTSPVADSATDTMIFTGTAPIVATGSSAADSITLSCIASSAGVAGCLSGTDWSTFNSKVATSRTINTTAPLTGGGDLSADRTFACTDASGGAKGCLTAADWTTFNGKQAAGSYQTVGVLLDGTNHNDTLAGSVARGDTIIGNSTPKWSRLAKGAVNTFLKSDGTDLSWSALTLAGAQFVNQGTTTQVLHGNAAGNPSWSAVSLSADVTGTLPMSSVTALAKSQIWQGNSAGATTAYVNPAGRDIRTYGALCDGSTDDSAAVQTCIDDANTATGGTCLVPATGTACVIKNEVTLKSNANIVCAPGARFAAGSGGTITNAVFNASSAWDNARITGCIFNADQVKKDMVRLSTKGAGWMIDHNKFYWNFDGDIASNDTTAIDYLEVGCTSNGGGVPSGQGCLLEANQILGSDVKTQNDRGINIAGGTNLFPATFIITENQINKVGGDCMTVTTGTSANIENNTLSGCHHNGIGNSASSLLSYGAVEGNTIFVDPSDGIIAADFGCSNCRVNGNIFPTNVGKGLVRFTDSSGTQFANNYAADGVHFVVSTTSTVINHSAIKNNVFNSGTCADDPIDGASLVSCVHVQNATDLQVISNAFVGTAPAGGISAIRVINRFTTAKVLSQIRILSNTISVTGAAGTDSCIDFDDQSGGAVVGFQNVQIVANSCGAEGAGPEYCVNVKNIAEDANWSDIVYDSNIFDDCTSAVQNGGTTTNVLPQLNTVSGTAYTWVPRFGPSPLQLAIDDKTAQTAAVGATTVYAVPATGQGTYRLDYYLAQTRAATTSSILGPVSLTCTDPDDSIAHTTPGTVALGGSGSTGNSIVNSWSGSLVCRAKLSTNIQYAVGYTSVGVTTMQYNAHVRLSRLD